MFNSEVIIPVWVHVYVFLDLAKVLESNETTVGMKVGNREVREILKKNGKISCFDSKVKD